MSLDTLPLDFLPEIFAEVSVSELKSLRLTNRVLSYIVAPFLFRKISINSVRQKGDTIKLFFDTATQPYAIARYAKTVHFKSVLREQANPHTEISEVGKLEKSLISRGMMALENAREVVIDCKDDPSWVKAVLLKAALRLPHLQRLTVRHPPADAFSVPTLSRVITATDIQSLQLGIVDGFTDKFPPVVGGMLSLCPNLLSLTLKGMTTTETSIPSFWGPIRVIQPPPPSLSSLIATLPTNPTPHLSELVLDNYFISFDGSDLGLFKSLTSITLRSVPEHVWYTPYGTQHTAFDGLWLALGEANVQLERVATEVITQSLMDYLASYSGVSHLVLGLDDGLMTQCYGPKPELLEEFAKRVIPRHESTLVSLGIFTNNAGDWTLCSDWLVWLEKCKVLEEVSFCLDFEPYDLGVLESTTKDLLKFSVLQESLRTIDIRASRKSWTTMSSRERYFRGKTRGETRTKIVDNIENFSLSFDQLAQRHLPLCISLPAEDWLALSRRWLTLDDQAQGWCFRL